MPAIAGIFFCAAPGLGPNERRGVGLRLAGVGGRRWVAGFEFSAGCPRLRGSFFAQLQDSDLTSVAEWACGSLASVGVVGSPVSSSALDARDCGDLFLRSSRTRT